MHLRILYFLITLRCRDFFVRSDECNESALLDVVFVVDNTASMQTLITQVHESLPPLVDEFQGRYRESRYGFFAVNDKDDSCKQTWAGFENGHCYRLILPLTSDAETAKSGLATIKANVGGLTTPEDDLGGLLVASHNADWRPLDPNQNILHIIILVTDAGYNQPGDTFNCKGPHFRSNDGDGDYDCVNEDYPSISQVANVMKAKHILPLFLTVNNQWKVYQELVEKLGAGGLSKDLSGSTQSVFDIIKEAVDTFVCVTTTPKPIPPETPTNGQGGNNGTNIGGIVGGTIAAIAGLAAVGGGVYVKFWRGKPSTGAPSSVIFGEGGGQPNLDDREQLEMLENSAFAS